MKKIKRNFIIIKLIKKVKAFFLIINKTVQNFLQIHSIMPKLKNININFHIFQIKKNKIHIYPVSHKTINKNLIKDYINLHNKNDIANSKNNIYLYEKDDNKYVRFCDILGKVSSNYYENKLWLE